MSFVRNRALLWVGLIAVGTAGCGPQSQPAAAPPRPEPSSEASTVKAEDIERTPSESIEKILEGRVAGVLVSRTPEGGIAVRIRGTTSFYGNNEPLYVLDGIAIQAGPGGALTGLNPHDIESIKVLKDVADTAMWGSRGANGVILITTKKPGRKPE